MAENGPKTLNNDETNTRTWAKKTVPECTVVYGRFGGGRVQSCTVAFWLLHGRYGRCKTVMYGRMVNPG